MADEHANPAAGSATRSLSQGGEIRFLAQDGATQLRQFRVLSEKAVDQRVAFLATLSGPVRANAKWLQAPAR